MEDAPFPPISATHYYQYDLESLASGKRALRKALVDWVKLHACQKRAVSAKALVETSIRTIVKSVVQAVESGMR